MIVETVRISQQGREQLISMKRKTGIENWNTICRWALCLSLAETSIPPKRDFDFEGGVEIAWRVFAGVHDEIYEALIRQRCFDDGLGDDKATLTSQFQLHLHRGLGYLSTRGRIQSIEELFDLLPLSDAA